jgi:hypothetical protein
MTDPLVDALQKAGVDAARTILNDLNSTCALLWPSLKHMHLDLILTILKNFSKGIEDKPEDARSEKEKKQLDKLQAWIKLVNMGLTIQADLEAYYKDVIEPRLGEEE